MIKMPKWRPALTDFEEQQLILQPECDTTFDSYYGTDILNPRLNQDENHEQQSNEAMLRDQELILVRRLRNVMNPDALVESAPVTLVDVDSPGVREAEITTMIRQYAGMGPSIDEGLCSSRTIPAIECDKPISRNGKFPILYDESHFKLKLRKPHSESTSSSSMNSSYEENNRSSSSVSFVNKPSPKKSVAGNVASTSSALVNQLDSSSKDIRSNGCLPDILKTSPNKPMAVNKLSSSNVKRNSKIAANFTGQCTSQKASSSQNNVEMKRNTIGQFLSPAELYRRKRQHKTETADK